ncbi:alpha/beta hydrolase [Peribacillus frigoritolerans]|uniref:alpha/beta hydrolase n=1 Tax=Peribacillus frigoritolerans TaxID=450367 RepID=UPI0010595AA4|nr:alpha/beta hydrolase [Peribacillus frigoritolerans]TDL83045.1 alpha/beta hydrolase [Peribacillus frigoritolerans]
MKTHLPIDDDMKELLDRIGARMAELKHPPLSELSALQSRYFYKEARTFFQRIEVNGLMIYNEKIQSANHIIPVRIYQPKSSELLPVLIFMHGGGWVFGDLESADSMCRYFAKNANCLIVSVGYRLAPEHPFPAALMDVLAVSEWVPPNISKWNGNPAQLALGGESSGANLAAAAVNWINDQGKQTFRLQVLITPVLNHNFDTESYRSGYSFNLTKEKMEWFWNHYLNDQEQGKNPYASPLLAVKASATPAMIVTVQYDPLRDEGKQYAEKLKDSGVPVTYLYYEKLLHSFPNMIGQVNRADLAMIDLTNQLKLLLRKNF